MEKGKVSKSALRYDNNCYSIVVSTKIFWGEQANQKILPNDRGTYLLELQSTLLTFHVRSISQAHH